MPDSGQRRGCERAGMSPQLSAALGFGIRELALAVVLVMSAAGALVLVGAAARGGRWRLLRPRRGTVSVGPWSPVAEGVRVLLDRGPARFRAESLTIVVENGGSLVIGAAGAADRSAARQVVVGRGGKLRVAAAEIGEPEEFLASGRTVWLCAEGGRASGPESAAAARARPGDGGPADGQGGVFGQPGGAR
jgi:hypothetical protein